MLFSPKKSLSFRSKSVLINTESGVLTHELSCSTTEFSSFKIFCQHLVPTFKRIRLLSLFPNKHSLAFLSKEFLRF